MRDEIIAARNNNCSSGNQEIGEAEKTFYGGSTEDIKKMTTNWIQSAQDRRQWTKKRENLYVAMDVND